MFIYTFLGLLLCGYQVPFTLEYTEIRLNRRHMSISKGKLIYKGIICDSCGNFSGISVFHLHKDLLYLKQRPKSMLFLQQTIEVPSFNLILSFQGNRKGKVMWVDLRSSQFFSALKFPAQTSIYGCVRNIYLQNNNLICMN
jgi:hypothetical protein